MLTIYEDLYLLALDEEKGNLFSFARKSFAYPLAGAILAELALSGKLGVGEKLRIVLSDATQIGDPILKDAKEAGSTHKCNLYV
jgi:golgi phosphoprotein 3